MDRVLSRESALRISNVYQLVQNFFLKRRGGSTVPSWAVTRCWKAGEAGRV